MYLYEIAHENSLNNSRLVTRNTKFRKVKDITILCIYLHAVVHTYVQ